MKRKYLLYAVFFILLIVAGYLLFTGRSGTYKSGEQRFAVRDTTSITLIEIRSPENTVLLERMGNRWMVNRHYNANARRISRLLILISRLHVAAPVPGSIRNEITGRLKKEGTRLMVITNRKNPNVIFMYHDTLYTNATYMMIEHADQVFRMEAPGFSNDLTRLFADDINYWRDHTMFHLSPVEILSVSLYDCLKPENSFRLISMGTGEFRLLTYDDSLEIKNYRPESVIQYLGYFSSVSFEQFITGGDDAVLSNPDKADKIITMRDVNNKTTEVKTYRRYITGEDGRPQPDFNRLYALINDTDMVLVKYVELDPVIKEIGYFLDNEKK